MSEEDFQLLRKDILEKILQLYQKPSPFLGNGFSISSRSGPGSNSLISPVSAGGVSVGPMTLPTGTAAWSGTAASATSSTPPEWGYLPYATSPNYKYHLIELENSAIDSLCGIEAHWREARMKPKPKRMCKTCTRVFEKNVLEGRYEG